MRASVVAILAAGAVASALPGSTASAPRLDPVIAAAGDIACDPANASFNGGDGTATACRQRWTAPLLAGADAVLTLGDLQYEVGAPAAFAQSYHPSWGQYRSTTYPAPGNHEYGTPGAAGYFDYFGAAAGDPAKGYYSFDLGTWHLVALNSECYAVGGCGPGSTQESWLRADLAATTQPCILAYWHKPRFTSSAHGTEAEYDGFWRALYSAGADVVLNGHEHNYERFAPQDPDRRPTAAGIREFVVGTGGRNHEAFTSLQPNSEVRMDTVFGVLKLTLGGTGYDWEFVAEGGSTLDSGSSSCTSSPTRAEVWGFSASRRARDVLLRWRSNTPTAALGFHVFRNGRRANARLIAGTGRLYEWVDRGAPRRTLRYTLWRVGSEGVARRVAAVTLRRG